MRTEDRLVGIGTIARELNAAPSTVRFWERRGILPAAGRIDGTGRRVWRVADIDALRARIVARRQGAEPGEPTAA